MVHDSKEKILKDWNLLEGGQPYFNDFSSLYEYLRGHSKEHGMQIKKEIYKQNYSRININRLTAKGKFELENIIKKGRNNSTTINLTFWKRIKELKRQHGSI